MSEIGTRVATAIANGTADEVVAKLTRDVRATFDDKEPVMLLAFASTEQPLADVLHGLRGEFPSARIMAASTAGEFTEHGDAKGSTAVFALGGDYQVHAALGTGLKADPEACVDRALAGMPREVHGYPHCTAILLLDPLAGNGEEATLITAEKLGFQTPLAGGAAGDDLHMERTWVGCGDRAESDALVIGLIYSKAPLGVGVSHGHLPVSDPLTVSRAEAATIYEIDGRPAWDVWVERTRDAARAAGLDPDALATRGDAITYLLRFEAGLAAGEDNYKIRAPLVKGDDGSISFACGIPEGSVIQITESVPAHQIDSAEEAARRARAKLGGARVAGAVVFDCICRNLILGDQFETAVKRISGTLGDAPLAGFETYGEIALDVGDMSGFHNTTTVVLAFPA